MKKTWERRIGIAAAAVLLLAVVPAVRADLTYGTPVPRGGGYEYVTFTAGSGMWTVPVGVNSVEVLVVGGGGGSNGSAGGGGGGGFYYALSYGVTGGTSVQVTVGTGGPGGWAFGVPLPNPDTAKGSDSQFDTLIAYGGGGGWNNHGGYSGGNNQGGTGITTANQGGNGAGFSGGNNDGGAGLQSTITGSPVGYGGGGGGSILGLGGGGGGGDAGQFNGDAGKYGVANTGGGGGGGWSDRGGDGGSGVVIVAYAIPEPASFGMFAATAAALLLRRKLRG
jgi:hypothetical protein